MNILNCQKVLLKTENKHEDNGKSVLDFTCPKTGLHFRLDPVENRIREDKVNSLCEICKKYCKYLNKK